LFLSRRGGRWGRSGADDGDRVDRRGELSELGHTFVANMTGNVVFLGFAVAPDSGFRFGPPTR